MPGPECTCHYEPAFAALDNVELGVMGPAEADDPERFQVEDAEGNHLAYCPNEAAAELVAAALNAYVAENVERGRPVACRQHPERH